MNAVKTKARNPSIVFPFVSGILRLGEPYLRPISAAIASAIMRMSEMYL